MTAAEMVFRWYGRSIHLRIESARDLQAVLELDEAHWVATSAPAEAFHTDPSLPALLDADGDGRVLAHELRAAIRWLFEHLDDPDAVRSGSRALQLSAIRADAPQGPRLAETARSILAKLGRADEPALTLEQVRQVKARVQAQPVSEAGVVLPQAADDAAVRGFLADIIATVGGAEHPSGAAGVGQAQLDAFLDQARRYLAWHRQGQLPPGQEPSQILPLGPRTPEAHAAMSALRDKLDQYFAQCDLAAFDPAFREPLPAPEPQRRSLRHAPAEQIDEALRAEPLARPRADGVLDMDGQTNPYYRSLLAALRERLVVPLLDGAGQTLTKDHWLQLKRTFAPYEAWLSGRESLAVASLDVERLREYLQGPYVQAVRELIAARSRTGFDLDSLRLVEKLLLYQEHLLMVANNFVSFPHLYDPSRRALFEMGTLIMDGRRFNLAVRVRDRAEHLVLARSGTMFLLYVEVAGKSGGAAGPFEVVVPVTSGGHGNLVPGKRGIFHDVAGREHDARVVQIVDNPVSLIEALWAPFRRIGRVLSGKIEAMSTTAQQKLDERTAAAFSQVEAAAQAQQAPPPPPAATAAARANHGLLAGGLVMGGGVALAAITSALAYVAGSLAELYWYEILIGIGGALAAVIVPTLLVAVLKLRKRDLSTILEGSGWAVNTHMRLTRRQRRFFTHRPKRQRHR